MPSLICGLDEKSLYCHNTHWCITLCDLWWYIFICVNEICIHVIEIFLNFTVSVFVRLIWDYILYVKNCFCTEFMYFLQNLIVLIRAVKLRWTPLPNYISSGWQAILTWENPERCVKTVVPHHHHRFFTSESLHLMLKL